MFDIVLLSTAEWSNPLWTNKQHTAVELVKQGHRVFYVESLGMRQPTLTSQDIRRIFKRLIRGLRAPREVRPGLWIWSPLVVPAAKHPWVRLLNRIWLSFFIRFWIVVLRFKKPLLWTYNPLTLDILDVSFFKFLVYHCVDNIAAQPGMLLSHQIKASESMLCKCSDLVFVTSRALYKKCEPLNIKTVYHTNVVDNEHFSKAVESFQKLPNDLLNIPEPRLLFVGAISAYKVDFSLIKSVAHSMPGCSFVMIGPVGEGDPHTDISELSDESNIHLLGVRSYSQLPAYMAHSRVGLLPCKINTYTESMFPMKFFEYLAGGLPVVATPLPALEEFSAYYFSANSAAEFKKMITLALSSKSIDKVNAAKTVLGRYSYESRTRDMCMMIESLST